MDIKVGQIVKNLIPDEAVKITKIQPLGSMQSISYVGINSKRESTKVIDEKTFNKLEVVTLDGTFTFDGDAEKFKLYVEAERIHSAYQFDTLFAVNCSIVDPLPHQVEAIYKYLLPLPKIRFLLADDTGAGKTIMTGILIKEMMMRGLIERILIITPGGLTKQWQEEELIVKFNLPFRLANRAAFQADPTIFSNSSFIITSLDFIRNEDVLNIAKEASWDFIVVDEAHKLSAFDYGNKRYRSRRYEALEVLSTKCEHLLLLTATPHRGRRDTFKNLLQLLDEDIFSSDSLVTARVKEIGENGVNKFFIRRLKEEMKDWQGKPLFKARHIKTVLYELTTEEKILYDKVTDYLIRRRKEARQEANIHVNLALMVMQRRLTSSIYAIMRTLKNRYNALNGLLEELAQNPNLWLQKQKMELNITDLDDFDEFDDEERESLENIISDPKKFKLFTTAKSPQEIREETQQVKELVDLSENLYRSNTEEQKLRKLRELFQSEGVLDKNEKIVIFTEHKDTLDYLSERLKNAGYVIEIIHGRMSVDERQAAQNIFRGPAQILIATDAAGEGINLQHCRLLINWDIPWNPNRLEQRMGRIHRYGQEKDVLVFNLVAQNTREGKVLTRLLDKLELIREQLGDDRVFDVISDIFEGVSLDDIINATFNGDITNYNSAIDSELTQENIKHKIKEQKEGLGYSSVDYKDAKRLKENSDEKRLQPIYIKLFFEKAFQSLGGKFNEIRGSIFRIENMPESISDILKKDYNINIDVRQIHFCFDKKVFLEYQKIFDLGRIHYINPGNPIFDSIIKIIIKNYKEDVLKGTVLISPYEKNSYYAFYVKSQITDERPHKDHESLADEKLFIVETSDNKNYNHTLPAKFIDLNSPSLFTKKVNTPDIKDNSKVIEWVFTNITLKQFDETRNRIQSDILNRKAYMEEAFRNIILDLTAEINNLQGKLLMGDNKVQDKIKKKQEKINELNQKKKKRLEKLELSLQLDMKPPEILGCAFIIPLTSVEFNSHFGMSRDDEAEGIAMQTALDYERKNGWNPFDVSKENAGYDIRSVSPDDLKRYIEVKGRNSEGGVMLSENEMNRLSQLHDHAWLYIVVNCKSKPILYRIQNPGKNLQFKTLSKGIQYLLSLDEWRNKAEKA